MVAFINPILVLTNLGVVLVMQIHVDLVVEVVVVLMALTVEVVSMRCWAVTFGIIRLLKFYAHSRYINISKNQSNLQQSSSQVYLENSFVSKHDTQYAYSLTLAYKLTDGMVATVDKVEDDTEVVRMPEEGTNEAEEVNDNDDDGVSDLSRARRIEGWERKLEELEVTTGVKLRIDEELGTLDGTVRVAEERQLDEKVRGTEELATDTDEKLRELAEVVRDSGKGLAVDAVLQVFAAPCSSEMQYA